MLFLNWNNRLSRTKKNVCKNTYSCKFITEVVKRNEWMIVKSSALCLRKTQTVTVKWNQGWEGGMRQFDIHAICHMKRDRRVWSKLGFPKWILLTRDQINKLGFKSLLGHLQTFNPGWAEHIGNIPLKAPTTTRGSQLRTGPLPPMGNPLWDQEKEPRQRELNVRQ